MYGLLDTLTTPRRRHCDSRHWPAAACRTAKRRPLATRQWRRAPRLPHGERRLTSPIDRRLVRRRASEAGMGAKSLTMGMADGAGGSGCRKHARRGSQGPFDDDDARSAVRPRSETSVVASLSCGRSKRRRASRSSATVMAPPVLDSTPGDAAMFGCVHWTRRASPVRVALGHYYLHDINAA